LFLTTKRPKPVTSSSRFQSDIKICNTRNNQSIDQPHSLHQKTAETNHQIVFLSHSKNPRRKSNFCERTFGVSTSANHITTLVCAIANQTSRNRIFNSTTACCQNDVASKEDSKLFSTEHNKVLTPECERLTPEGAIYRVN
jgi:hypothetical protein